MHRCGMVGLFTLLPLVAAAQPQPATLEISVQADNQPVPAADVVVAGETWTTGEAGTVTVSTRPGPVTLVVVKTGFLPLTTSVTVDEGEVRALVVELTEQPYLEEEVIVVAATRTNKRLADQPMRVEVLDREEIEEKILMTPGDIVMLLNETGGLRVQATAPALGAASVRIQGMRGRHTRFLSDGLPCLVSRSPVWACCRCRRWIWAKSRSSRGWPRRSTGPVRWVVS